VTAPARLPATNICGDRIGTEAGAARHYRAGEAACPPCRAGERQAKAARKAGRKARKATSKEIGAQNARAKTIKHLGYDPWERWENEKHAAAQRINDYWRENCS